MPGGERRVRPPRRWRWRDGDPADISFAVEGGIDPNDLAQAGWGVIYAPGVSQKIKDALQPLLDHRKARRSLSRFSTAPTATAPGDSANDWLKRRNVRMDVVDPENGVPFYLLLVGPPDEMPFEFQYSLDIYWAAGRLWFDTPDEFRRYAESVVAYETRPTVPTSRRGVMFATEHDFDEATQLFTRQVARPLCGRERRQTYGRGEIRTCRASRRHRDAVDIGGYPARQGSGTPALLVSGSHGLEFRSVIRVSARRRALSSARIGPASAPSGGALVRRIRCPGRRQASGHDAFLLRLPWRRMHRVRRL